MPPNPQPTVLPVHLQPSHSAGRGLSPGPQLSNNHVRSRQLSKRSRRREGMRHTNSAGPTTFSQPPNPNDRVARKESLGAVDRLRAHHRIREICPRAWPAERAGRGVSNVSHLLAFRRIISSCASKLVPEKPPKPRAAPRIPSPNPSATVSRCTEPEDRTSLSTGDRSLTLWFDRIRAGCTSPDRESGA